MAIVIVIVVVVVVVVLLLSSLLLCYLQRSSLRLFVQNCNVVRQSYHVGQDGRIYCYSSGDAEPLQMRCAVSPVLRT